MLMAALQANTSGPMARLRDARKTRHACWCCWPVAQAEGGAVGEQVRRDGMAPHRSQKMLCLLALRARRTG